MLIFLIFAGGWSNNDGMLGTGAQVSLRQKPGLNQMIYEGKQKILDSIGFSRLKAAPTGTG